MAIQSGGFLLLTSTALLIFIQDTMKLDCARPPRDCHCAPGRETWCLPFAIALCLFCKVRSRALFEGEFYVCVERAGTELPSSPNSSFRVAVVSKLFQ